ncbi:MAG: nicotinate-nucleotide adenylyltransferase [Thermoguttaceae bacterium]
MRYGIYGGAFDPIHLGHLILAEACLHSAKLDRVVFVPTGMSPHRSGKDNYKASPQDRFTMIESVICSCDEFLVSRFEIDRSEPSYTIETIRYFKHTFALVEPELFLILGSDMFNDLPNWYMANEICELATPLVVSRAGFPPPYFDALSGIASRERIADIRAFAVSMPGIDIASRNIRMSVAENRSIRFQVPRSVEMYIEAHHLYK